MSWKNDNLVGINISNPIKEIRHADLKRLGDSAYRSECPECKEGVLLVCLDQRTLKLLEIDRCVLCGQQFRYLDIAQMRKGPLTKRG